MVSIVTFTMKESRGNRSTLYHYNFHKSAIVMYNDSGCKTDVRKVNASQRRKYKFKVTRTDSTDMVQSMLFAMVLVIHRTRHIAPLTSTFDILLLLDGMV